MRSARMRDGAYLAFDLGATSWRAILGFRKGNRLELEELTRERNVPLERGGGLFWDMERLFRGMKEVLRKAAREDVRLSAVGIDSWSVDYGLLDERGELLETPRSYRDKRNLGMRKKVARKAGARELFLRTGVMAEDITTLCQLSAALQQTPQLVEQAACLLFIPDVLRWRLCGEKATDFPMATTSQLYSIRDKRWDEEQAGMYGVPASILPPVRHGPGVLGCLSREIQRETGLGPVPVTLGASHDTAAAFSTVPAYPGDAILSSGTWSILGVNMEHPVFFDSIDTQRYGYEGNTDGTVRFVCNIPGMWILEQSLEVWLKNRPTLSYEELIEGARNQGSFDSRIDPYDSAFEAPVDMAAAVVKYCGRTGQPEPETVFQTARAIFLGLAEAYAAALADMERITGRKIVRLHVIGGGSRNELLNRMISERGAVEVVRGEAEAAAVGNILNQELAVGTSPGR